MGSAADMNNSKLGGLITIWLLCLLIGAVFNYFRTRKVNVSRGYLGFLALMFVLDFVRIFNPDNVSPSNRAHVFGQLFGIYVAVTLVVWLGAWIFDKRRVGVGAVQAHPGRYRDLGTLTGWVTACLLAQTVIIALSGITGIQAYRVLQNYEAGTYLTQKEAIEAGDRVDGQRQELTRPALLVYLISAIVMLRWIYRASSNAWQFGAHDMKYSPGWSVRAFFVPPLQLWTPFLAMRETWRVSHDPLNWKTVRVAPVLYCWWALCLFALLLWLFVVQVIETDDIPHLKLVTQLLLVRDFTYALLVIATLILIRRIQHAQRQQTQA